MSANFLSQGSAGFYKQQSLYGLLRMLGVGDHPAFAAQGLLLLAMAGIRRLAVAKPADPWR